MGKWSRRYSKRVLKKEWNKLGLAFGLARGTEQASNGLALGTDQAIYGSALGLAKVQHAEQKLWTDSGSESGSTSSA